MKKISAFFLSIFLMALLSCAPEEDTKTIIITPPELMSAVTCSIQSGMITADDKISLNAPQNATDATLYYEIAVGADCKTPTEGSSKKYTGEITLSSAGLDPSDDDIITLKVLAVKKGFENGVWAFRWRFSDGSKSLVNDDAFLKSVSASNNEANIVLLPNVFVYDEISVPNDVEKISINYEKSNKDATVETYPASLKDISLTDGRTTLITFTVTSSDKSTKKRYSFNIYRASKEEPPFKSTDCFLSSLLVKDDTTIAFDKNKENYKAKVANSVDTTSVTYVLSSNKAQVVTNPASLDNISLMPGQTRDVSITVTAEDSSFTKTYTVSIYREPAGQLSSDATLKSLSVIGGNLSFNSATTDYEVTIPADSATVSVMYEENHIGATVTTIPTNLNNISIAPGATETVTILVTAENKVATETYTVKIKRDSVNLDGNANLSGITLSDGSLSFNAATTEYDVVVENAVSSITVTATAESAKATVVVDPSGSVSLTAGAKTSITIYVTAEDGTPKTYTVNVTRQNGGITPPPPPPPAGEYYWTNKDGKVGTNKTISSLSSWSESDKIIQGVACDTPRCWLGGHEFPDPDLYAMFAAWDDKNLYLMIEIPNVDNADAVDNDKCYAGSQFLPMGIVMNTGKRTPGDGTLINGNSVWQGSKLYSWKAIDTMLMFHPRLNIGEPSVFMTDSTGKFTYDDKTLCVGFKLAGVERNVYFNESVSANMWAAVTDSEGNWGGKSSTDMSTYTYVDYKASGKKMSSYQLTIPLASIGIDKNYIESVGISVGAFSTYGASAMDCLPWDDCMIDCAAESYSSDPSSSKEKEDIDELSYLARIGKM